jgi:hypothetical protein
MRIGGIEVLLREVLLSLPEPDRRALVFRRPLLLPALPRGLRLPTGGNVELGGPKTVAIQITTVS